jgi:hypothetical protein
VEEKCRTLCEQLYELIRRSFKVTELLLILE